MNSRCFLVTLLTMPLSAWGGTSANYRLAPEAVDQGGLRGTSANYSADFSAMPGGAGSTTNYTARTGYAGQLGDVVATATELSAPQLTVNEQGTLQLRADLVFDDLTTSPLDPNSVTWSVQSGALTSISASGLATAAAVYQDSPAVAHGAYQTFTDTLALTVINTLPDNFGSYATDGIADDWQVQYFGLPPNAAAGPLVDPDFDGQNNLFEFTAGLIPNSNLSRFLISAKGVTGQPSHKDIVFSPVFGDRSYLIQTSTTLLNGSWSPLAGGTVINNGSTRTVTDPNATGPRKFYRVQITWP